MVSKTESEIMGRWKTEYGDIPLVSILCVAYNQESYIARALDGFLIQKTDFPFEIIIHDDASSDRTAKIIKSYEKRYPHIMKAIYEMENQWSKQDGSIQRIMQGYVRGKYVALCEGDDYWTDEGKLQKQILFMESDEKYAMTYHAVRYVNNGKIKRVDKRFRSERDVSSEKIIEGGGEFIATASICYRNEYGVLFPEFRKKAAVGDYPLQVLLAVSGKVHYFPEVLANYEECSVGSWSERSKKAQQRIEHNVNEILWLSCFDEYSGFLYHMSVRKRIYKCYMCLYYLGYVGKEEINKMILRQYSKLQRVGKIAEFQVYRLMWFFRKHCNCIYAFCLNIYLLIKRLKDRVLK